MKSHLLCLFGVLSMKSHLLCLFLRLQLVFLAVIVLWFCAEEPLDNSYDEDREEAKEEGEDRGEKEAPPLSLLQTFLVVNERDPLWGESLLANPHGKGSCQTNQE